MPAWHSGLTKKQAASIERVQRVAAFVILSDCVTGQSEYSYNVALDILGIATLEKRRVKLCQSFATKTLNPRHVDIFRTNPNLHFTRSKPEFFINKCNTKRFFNSPVNYLTRILNSDS